MQLIDLLAAAGQAAPQNKFGFAEALEQGGFIAYATVTILGVMSFGSFYPVHQVVRTVEDHEPGP